MAHTMDRKQLRALLIAVAIAEVTGATDCPVYFVDADPSGSGVVFVGTPDHMRGLALSGGAPVALDSEWLCQLLVNGWDLACAPSDWAAVPHNRYMPRA